VTTVPEQITVIRAAAALLADRAELVPAGPWYLKPVIGRIAICDMAGRVVAWIPDATGTDVARYLATFDPAGTRLETALLTAVADGAELALKLLPSAVPEDMPAEVTGYIEALALARHLLEEASS
jgi:hypothetical protein